ALLQELQDFAVANGFVQLMPIMMSPFTDTLSHDVYPAEIRYLDIPLKLTASMIFHKQLALIPRDFERIFIVSPNIRLEKAEIKSSANHLLEFSQFDIEIKDAGMEQVMDLLESLFVQVFTNLRQRCAADLMALGRDLPDLQRPFPRYRSEELERRYGADYYRRVSDQATQPCFIVNFKREFYDREEPGRPGTYRNFDLVYPDGFGEGLSGAEREHRYDDIVRRMEDLAVDQGTFKSYLAVAAKGLLPRSAGAGIGIQRLVKFICGCRRISEVCMFDRSVASEFTF
ncbi:MAG TPA: asparagine synthetase A, partial [Thermoanaerobaculia bacterium]|nr:asparagine synthetase A [Thermoanaerobaculia bacterium]